VCDLARTHWRMQVKVSLEVTTLDILMSFVVALDGSATVFPTSTTVDFLPEVRRLLAGHQRAVLHRWARTWQHGGGVPTPRMAHDALTENVTAAQMAGAASSGVAC
jgi:hypothetical protein